MAVRTVCNKRKYGQIVFEIGQGEMTRNEVILPCDVLNAKTRDHQQKQ